MINVVVPTSRFGRAGQAERVVDAQIRFDYGKTLRAMWRGLHVLPNGDVLVDMIWNVTSRR